MFTKATFKLKNTKGLKVFCQESDIQKTTSKFHNMELVWKNGLHGILSSLLEAVKKTRKEKWSNIATPHFYTAAIQAVRILLQVQLPQTAPPLEVRSF